MLKDERIRKFNELDIPDMEEVTQLHELRGDFINLQYKLPSGRTIKIWDDDKPYYGAQLCKKDGKRCYGLVADDRYLPVCEYGDGGSDAEIVILERL